MKWQEFWDTYESTVHNNAELPLVEKFKYLKSFLSGDALRLAGGYRLTNVNYESVITVLKERYGDPEIAIFSHFDSMLALPVASGSVADLRQISDECEKHIRCLVALGLPEDTFGRVFTPIMLSKLPQNVRVELHRQKSGSTWTLAELRKLLCSEIAARDMSKRTFGSSGNAQSGVNEHFQQGSGAKQSKGQTWSGRQHSASNFVASGKFKKVTPGQKRHCRFCGGQHYSDTCRSYSTLQARRERINGACFCCLGNDHVIAECKLRKACFFCKKDNHHSSLCPSKFGSHGGASGATALSCCCW
jgi:hypothetical protein